MARMSGILFAIAAAGTACHHDGPAATNAASPNNGAATMGGASTENSSTGGQPGSAPGDRYNNAGVDPATGMANDAGVGDGGTH